MTVKLREPGAIERAAGDVPPLRLPERGAFFRERAARLERLAAGHSLGDYLGFAARLAALQQALLDRHPEVPLPDAAALERARRHGMPPLPARGWARDPVWRAHLAAFATGLAPHAPAALGAALAELARTGEAAVEQWADGLLAGDFRRAPLALAPLLAAALQVYWTHMVTRLGAGAIAANDLPGLCPACASAPVASVVHIGAADHGLRYLHCSLCGLAWHMVRIKCSNCDSTGGIHYYALDGGPAHAKAEACDACGSYLKIFYREKDPQSDPVADDLATLALDLLMDERGSLRSGPNLLLIPATAEAPDGPATP
jgi:FdhE protein